MIDEQSLKKHYLAPYWTLYWTQSCWTIDSKKAFAQWYSIEGRRTSSQYSVDICSRNVRFGQRHLIIVLMQELLSIPLQNEKILWKKKLFKVHNIVQKLTVLRGGLRICILLIMWIWYFHDIGSLELLAIYRTEDLSKSVIPCGQNLRCFNRRPVLYHQTRTSQHGRV